MWFRKLVAMIKCLLTGHLWFYHRDFKRVYKDTGIYVRKRSCNKCGKREVGVFDTPHEMVPAYSSIDSDKWNEECFWISERRAKKYMKGVV